MSAYIVEYGLWNQGIHDGVTTRAIPGHNTAYRRKDLIETNALLEVFIQAERIFQLHLLGKGTRFFHTTEFTMFHKHFLTWPEYLKSEFWYGWGYAFTRWKTGHWGRPMRLLFCFGILLKPLVRWWILIKESFARKLFPLTTLLKYSPGITLGYFFGAAGECCGYLLGARSAALRLTHYEIGYVRNPRTEGQ
jgi:hypothetical protein